MLVVAVVAKVVTPAAVPVERRVAERGRVGRLPDRGVQFPEISYGRYL